MKGYDFVALDPREGLLKQTGRTDRLVNECCRKQSEFATKCRHRIANSGQMRIQNDLTQTKCHSCVATVAA
jgi:hypothetical protein